MLKKRSLLAMTVLMGLLALTGCRNKALEEASSAVEQYNAEAAAYNERLSAYTASAEAVEEANAQLHASIDAAQEAIDRQEIVLDESTLQALTDAVASAAGAEIAVPEITAEEAELLTVEKGMKKEELQAIKDKATAGIEELKAEAFDDMPDVPDYSGVITAIEDSLKAYEDSVAGAKLVTAPAEDYVLERLGNVETISAAEAVSEGNDPNSLLGTEGGYSSCIYFRDDQVDQSQLLVGGDPESVIDTGTQGGGCVEIYDTVEAASERDAYLATFDDGQMSAGSHHVAGTVIIRTSGMLSAEQQDALTEEIIQALTADAS